MSTRQVTVEYTGSTSFDIDEAAIVDDLAIMLNGDADGATDEQIDRAIGRDIDSYMEHGSSVQPVQHIHRYDRVELIASVRAEIARRAAESEED